MSDMKKIIDSRRPGREAKQDPAARQIKAQEDTADALEGIRQDLTAITLQLEHLVQAVAKLDFP